METTFYVILSGSVGVNLLVPNRTLTEEDQLNKSQGHPPKAGHHHHHHKHHKHKQKAHKETNEQELELTEVTVLTPGSFFGELALLNDAPRIATIICKEPCSFAVLERSAFKSVLGMHCISVGSNSPSC